MTATAFRVHHVSLSVADLSAQETWYSAAFGLTHVDERFEMPDAGVRTAVLSSPDGLRFEFVERTDSTPVTATDPFAATATQTYTHLALQVPHLDAAYLRLTAQCDATPVSPPAAGVSDGMRYAYIGDPEGNLIELVETGSA